jgi:hypothetical protein
VDGTPPVLEPVPVVVPDPFVEPLGSPLLPIGGEPLATEPQGRPIASVRPVLFSEFVVDELFIDGVVLDELFIG